MILDFEFYKSHSLVTDDFFYVLRIVLIITSVEKNLILEGSLLV